MVTTYLEQLLCAGTAVYLSLVCVSSGFFFKNLENATLAPASLKGQNPFAVGQI